MPFRTKLLYEKTKVWQMHYLTLKLSAFKVKQAEAELGQAQPELGLKNGIIEVGF